MASSGNPVALIKEFYQHWRKQANTGLTEVLLKAVAPSSDPSPNKSQYAAADDATLQGKVTTVEINKRIAIETQNGNDRKPRSN
ncbi:putative G-protein coupled receptor 174 isoform 2-T4 [Glossophaga mutica]